MEPTNNSSSSTNTILIVILLLIVVGFGVYWFAVRTAYVAPYEPVPQWPEVDINISGGAAGTSEEGKTPADTNDTPDTPMGGEVTP